MQLFCDMDGVLADFDAHHKKVFGYRSSTALDNVLWGKVRKIPHFYLHLPPMEDKDELWEAISPCNPIVLTGVPRIKEAASDKHAWAHTNLIPPAQRIVTCPSRDKFKHMIAPGDVIIDDWEKHKQAWVDAGGIWVTHTSAKDTIKQLQALGVI